MNELPEAKADETRASQARLRALRKQLIRRRGKRFGYLADHLFDAWITGNEAIWSSDFCRSKAVLRFAARIAKVHPDQTTVGRILQALQAEEPEAALGDVLKQANRERILRQAAAFHTTRKHRELAHFVSLLNRPFKVSYSHVELGKPEQPAERLGEQLRAFTDSKQIVLPPVIATTTSAMLNQDMAFYICGHELAHILFGSFRYSGASRRGRLVKQAFRKFESRHVVGFHAGLIDAGNALVEKEFKGKLITARVIERHMLNGFAALFASTPWPKLCAYLFNGLEDGRIEQGITDLFPGLARIRTIHEAYAKHLYEAPHFKGAIHNLLVDVAGYAADRQFPSLVSEEHLEVRTQCRLIIDRWSRLGRRRDVYHSLLTVSELLEALWTVLANTPEAQAVENEMPESNALTVDMAKLRALLGDEDNKKRHEGIFRADDQEKAPETPQLFEELVEVGSSDNIVLQTDVVEVVNKPYELLAKERLAVLPALQLPFPALVDQHLSNLPKRRFHQDGRYIATNRLAPFYATLKAGQADFPLMYDRANSRLHQRVTIIVDLSLSMERKLLGGELPLQRAIQLTKWLASNLSDQEVQVDVIGCHDGGRRPVFLRPLPSPSAHAIESLRAAGFGGCRLGAAIRAIHNKHGQSDQSGRMVIAISDAVGMYLRPGSDQTIQSLQRLCFSCGSRRTCNHELTAAAFSLSKVLPNVTQFASEQLAWSDVADALETTRTRFHLFAIHDNLNLYAGQLDEHLGSNRWSDATASQGVLQGIENVARQWQSNG